ncbi:MAG TPA: HEAT repeat domain-containing protein [Vicinamibacterales bacterium]|nr:HEAT repeat domain-containing protein [Vicinamibacterales bacterium]
MMHRSRLIGSILTFATAAAVVAAAQQPRVSNGKVTPQPAGAQFQQSFRALVSAQPDVAWIGYSVPVVDGERVMCCFDGGTTFINGSVVTSDGRSCCRACRLEPSADGTSMATRAPAASGAATVRLQSSERMVVLYRVAAREIERVRVFSEDCELDAGGRQVIWLEGVRSADSIALLESLTAGDRRTDRIVDSVVSAIALHGDPAADASLERLAAVSQPESQRKKVTFWLGNARGARGLATLKRMLADDPSVEVQKGAVFGVSQSKETSAFDTLAALTRDHANARIRSEAVFWIAHKDDPRAAKIILEALEKDPSPEVRKKAVFALSQLKDNAGVDALIRVARNGPDAATRGEAIFWLGQKAGQKAAAAITERIDQDPDTEVKKKAVFALSQMPKDEGIPLLINVARTHSNPAVRKQAMFWLGQSKDPRAIEFFAEILK